MNRPGKLLDQDVIDHPMPLEAASSVEGPGNEAHMKMRLTAWPRAGMSGMLVALVGNLELAWRERAPELLFDSFCGPA
jgi:hypothetical protein